MKPTTSSGTFSNSNAPVATAEFTRSGGRLYAQKPEDLPLSEATVLSGDPDFNSSAQPSAGPRPGYEEISKRAYDIWQRSGSVHDQHLDHWYEAQRQLETEGSKNHFDDGSGKENWSDRSSQDVEI